MKRIPIRGWALVSWVAAGHLFGALAACKPDSRPSASDAKALIGLGSIDLAKPKPLASARLGEVIEVIGRQSFARAATQSTAALRRGAVEESLLVSIAAEGGIPRWQVRAILMNVIAGDGSRCGGANCAVALGFAARDVEPLLDGLYLRVKSDPRLKDPDHHDVYARLVGSLAPDRLVAPLDSPSQSVAFDSDAFRIAAQRALGKSGRITQGEVNRIAHLDLERVENAAYDFAELGRFPALKSVSIKLFAASELAAFAPYAHLVKDLELVHPFLSAAPVIGLGDLLRFKYLTSLERLALVDFALGQPERLLEVLPPLRGLGLSNFSRHTSDLTDALLAQLARLPNLRQLELGLARYADAEQWRSLLPQAFAEVKITVKGREQSCGTLAALAVFARAQAVTVRNCGLTGLGGFSRPVAWRILTLENEFVAASETPVLNLSLGPELNQLLIFRASSPAVRLDQRSQHELAVRLAKRGSNP